MNRMKTERSSPKAKPLSDNAIFWQKNRIFLSHFGIFFSEICSLMSPEAANASVASKPPEAARARNPLVAPTSPEALRPAAFLAAGG